MITHMKTDEFWLEHGGNGPNWNEGGELMKEYLKRNDEKGVERKDSLIVPYNKMINANMWRPYIENITIHKGTVKMIMMSGKEFEVSLAFVESYADLMSAVFKELTPKRVTRISIVVGDRVLSSSNSRLIITDGSVLTIVLSKDRK